MKISKIRITPPANAEASVKYRIGETGHVCWYSDTALSLIRDWCDFNGFVLMWDKQSRALLIDTSVRPVIPESSFDLSDLF